MSNTCAIIPFDQIGCLNINLISGLKKEIPFTFTRTIDAVTTPIDLSQFDEIKLNVYNSLGISSITALSKSSIDNPTELFVDGNNDLILIFGSETLPYKDNEFYYNLEFLKAGEPSEFYVQGFLKLTEKRNRLQKVITTI